MKKESKLREKPARMPEIREPKWEQVIPAYLESVQSQSSESAKSQRFLLLLNELFGVQPGFIEEYVSGVEKYVRVKQKDHLLRGTVDSLFGNLVIEFERDLARKQKEAEEQLQKYIACLWSQETPKQRTPYLCIATDGVSFAVYSPTIPQPDKMAIQPQEVRLELVEQVDWTGLSPPEVYFWLDRYFLRREILSPKTENVVQDFGVKSHAFQVADQALLCLWNRIKDKPEFKVVYENWEKYLRIVYGTSVAEEELFVRHTYLATLAKLMAWSRLAEGKSSPDSGQILSVLEGRFFKERGIENFLEEDFFSWLARKDAWEEGWVVTRRLLSLLRNYNLRELSEDVLKALYQELVDPRTRHDLGEYYTPDWLAHRIVRRLLERKPEGLLLDPACGSGTFLYLAVREKRAHRGDSWDTLIHILDSVVGVDIHPLAVIIAKTNYILALGDLLKKRKGKISIPVYLADTLKLPEREVKPTLWRQAPGFRLELNGETIYLPEKLLESPALYDEAIEAAKEYAAQNAGKTITQQQFFSFLRAHHPPLMENEVVARALFFIAETLKAFIESQRDTIWAFVLKNSYKPLFLKGKFDFVLGNPPWLSYRYVEQREYQRFLKKQITTTYRLLSGRGELITHLELGTLFFVRAADLYLKEGGSIAFVLPRIYSADQHHALRQGSFQGVSLAFQETWDLEKVEPLFKVPACVLFARKERDAQAPYSVAGQKLSGKLKRCNASLEEAEEELTVEETQIYLHRKGKRSFWSTQKSVAGEKEVIIKGSHYQRRFRQGATIVPRSLWFVEVKVSPLGFDPSLPPVETSRRAREEAKDAYRDLALEGNVESRFLYATLLSTDLLPFGHLGYRLVVLPIEPSGGGYCLLTAGEARRRGFLHLARWLERAQEEWDRRRRQKAERMDALEWLDYRRKLTSQSPQAKYRVLYNTSGTYLCACVLERQPLEFHTGDQTVEVRGFVADYVTHCLEVLDRAEAYYVAALLNCPLIDRLIKSMQAPGLWGPRHICKKVLELPLPQFDPSQEEHLRLAELGRICAARVAQWQEAGGAGEIRSIGRLRGKVREMLRAELREIDTLVEQLLRSG